ncbi:tail fiber assembly protein [Dickeya sp. CFBP 2040]|uniref:Tail fiber assembly protein n=1 Tax=Dickeya poaceiphila TaxID=568768 RepID=A0A5B8I0L1_9GAMM|nr:MULTISPECIES: tail fiber assembly protein [Dickeya]NKI73013.1 tail fiber assembly protein [Dickeya sp. CFBP 2040]QDX28533.1 tail fiber assembly protein [Dickeya poaceiphila]
MSKIYAVIENGVVMNTVVWDSDVGADWKPQNGALIDISSERVGVGYLYSDGVFTPPEKSRDEYIADATLRKTQLLSEAQKMIANWQTDLLLGVISDDDKSRLVRWREYMKQVDAIDAQSAPDITWPVPPAA